MSMVFEVSRDNTSAYTVRNFAVRGISVSDFEQKIKRTVYSSAYLKVENISLVLFAEKDKFSDNEVRFTLGVCLNGGDDIIWVCRNFSIPEEISSDEDFISGILIGWLNT